MPSFDINQGFDKNFVVWITTPIGGNKNNREAVQCGKRGLKYFKQNLYEKLAKVIFAKNRLFQKSRKLFPRKTENKMRTQRKV